MTRAENEEPPGSGDRPRRGHGSRGRRRPRRRVFRRIVIGCAVLALVAGGTAWWMYEDLDGNITAVDLEEALGDDRPAKEPAARGALDILVLGSDSRAGDNAALDGGEVGGARSDTALVVHVAEGRSEAVAVSVPRDTLVDRPACRRADGTEVPPAKRVMFNSVYSQVGSACTLKTVETMSGVRIDHLMEIDFAGFKTLVDELGGVTVDVEEPIRDTKGGFTLEPGRHRLDGTESLRFVRTRHGYGDGSDLGRIGLQQQFLVALIGEVRRQDLLGDPVRTYRIADSLTGALTTDSDLASLTSLAEFGRSLQGIDPSALDTVMLPVKYDTADPNRVVPAQPLADEVWEALRNDRPIPESARRSPAGGGS
ncbi:LCP family protein [Streptomyces sp. MJP52]|uniref:LCP family protein n=1 Tax=Streptomyces sp. MJP52 TaxID=2940555 RepID=UPI00247729BC|nr:LCP family protein [Streptomyces sp. MJP52]MDH6226026.1 LCP family protein required for cell wall assembly [Streptomyces sp. MJP52]